MAVGRRDISLTRDDVYAIIKRYKRTRKADRGKLEDFVRAALEKKDEAGLEVQVDEDTVKTVVDLVMEDLESYGASSG